MNLHQISSIWCFSFFVKSSSAMTIHQNDLKPDNNLFQYKSFYFTRIVKLSPSFSMSIIVARHFISTKPGVAER